MSMREPTVMKKKQRNGPDLKRACNLRTTLHLTFNAFSERLMMYSLYDKINVKRIQARFKKYIHTKKCVGMNFLHFVGV